MNLLTAHWYKCQTTGGIGAQEPWEQPCLISLTYSGHLNRWCGKYIPQSIALPTDAKEPGVHIHARQMRLLLEEQGIVPSALGSATGVLMGQNPEILPNRRHPARSNGLKSGNRSRGSIAFWTQGDGSVKCLPHKPKDLSWSPSSCIESRRPWHVPVSLAMGVERGGSLGLYGR